MTDAIKVKTSFDIRFLKEINDINPREIMQMLLNHGCQKIILVGSPIDKLANYISLYVENDVEFIIDSYLYLEELFLKKEAFKHNTFLSDGLLEVKAKIEKEIVDVTYNYYPELNIKNLISYSEKFSKNKYLFWWRNLTYDLVSLAITNPS
ncbi:hypothetical protein H6F61_22430 [Cyanobacteria bacterium FACHB-472]|nr:hypothetical protein [Cyanobacteria bacterium FACHB-472]